MMFLHNIRTGTAYLGATEQALKQREDGLASHKFGLKSAAAIKEPCDVAQQRINSLHAVAKSIFKTSNENAQEFPRSKLAFRSFMFMNWPDDHTRRLSDRIAQAYAKSSFNGVIRYTALLGFHVNLPIWLGLTGFDIRRFVISTDFIHFGVPFWSQIRDAIHATTGEVNEIITERSIWNELARERAVETMNWQKVTPLSGYSHTQAPWFYASLMGELLRQFGIGPNEVMTANID